MFRKVGTALVLCLLVLGTASIARGEISQEGNLRITFQGDFSPHKLPRDRPAPVTVDIEGRISTTDGTQPPALQQMTFKLDRHGVVSLAGLPTCSTRELQSTTTKTALERCRPALVGRGNFSADVKFQTAATVPAGGPMLAFNGTYSGKPALLLHLFGTVPVQATFVLPLTITHEAQGRYGTTFSGRIPQLAGGFGSITQIHLKLGRNYAYKGQRRSYISASCAAPGNFPGASFTFARGDFKFADGRTIRTTVARNCSVR